MKSPAYRAKQFVTTFQKYYKDEFEKEWKAKHHPIDTTPHPGVLEEYEAALHHCEEFRNFCLNNSTTMSTDSPCQCSLIDKGNQHILSNNILHDICEFDCECSTPLKVLVP